MKQLRDALFSAAYFWRLNPFDLEELPLSLLSELIDQGMRIADEARNSK